MRKRTTQQGIVLRLALLLFSCITTTVRVRLSAFAHRGLQLQLWLLCPPSRRGHHHRTLDTHKQREPSAAGPQENKRNTHYAPRLHPPAILRSPLSRHRNAPTLEPAAATTTSHPRTAGSAGARIENYLLESPARRGAQAPRARALHPFYCFLSARRGWRLRAKVCALRCVSAVGEGSNRRRILERAELTVIPFRYLF